ncbi:MAG: hypothetical protein AABX69_01575, partial [Nanoarchaeota archaeon]
MQVERDADLSGMQVERLVLSGISGKEFFVVHGTLNLDGLVAKLYDDGGKIAAKAVTGTPKYAPRALLAAI